jgi:hypothetical protein
VELCLLRQGGATTELVHFSYKRAQPLPTVIAASAGHHPSTQLLETSMSVSTLTASEEMALARAQPNTAVRDRAEEAGAISWAAILAGAAAAASLSLILLVLGVGLGLSAVSPWSQAGITAATFGVSTILWVTFTQIVASGMGGYLAGRLRVRWRTVHTDEVYFRDTAHGFLAWAMASLATAALLGSVIGSVVSGGVQAGASVAGTALTTGAAAIAGSATSKLDEGNGSMNYMMDTLFRKDAVAANTATASNAAPASEASPSTASSAEVVRIFMNGINMGGTLPAEDARYLAQTVAQRTGLSAADAEKRVNAVYTRAQTQWQDAKTNTKQAADAARKASAYGALWLFVSLLMGAFASSLAATFGGRQRDA